jgi:hypothetical protein
VTERLGPATDRPGHFSRIPILPKLEYEANCTLCEPRILIYVREKDQQDAHFLLIQVIYFNWIILDMFQNK